MIQVIKIPKEGVIDIWAEMRDSLLKPMVKCTTIDRFPLDFLLLSLIKGEKQAWIIWDGEQEIILASLVTEINHYPTGLAINLFLLGGESMDLWHEQLTHCLFNYAQEIGAKWLDTYSRRGFWKTLENLNFNEESTHYSITI
ncbi:MAG: hypothetical protein WBI40_13175 [Methylococcaceae bacterium]